MRENVLRDKSFAFAVRIVNMYKYLSEDKREFVLLLELWLMSQNIQKVRLILFIS